MNRYQLADQLAAEAAIKIVNESSCISDELGGIQNIIQAAIEKARENDSWTIRDLERQRDNFKAYALAHASEEREALAERAAQASEDVELTCPHCHKKHTHYIDTDQYERGYTNGWEACDREAERAAQASEEQK